MRARRAISDLRELEAEALDGCFVGAHPQAVGYDDELADARIPGADLRGRGVIRRPQRVAPGRRGAQLVEPALVDDAARADDRHAVAELLDLVHEVAREQHRDAALGQRADERAHVAHARRVEAGRRLVQQQQARAADQRAGDAEALAHAVGVAADAILRPAGEVDGVERRVDLRARVAAVERRHQLEVLAAREVRVEARRLDEPRDALEGAHAVDHRIPAEQPGAPPLGRISPSSMRSDVVLPAPFGPRYP